MRGDIRAALYLYLHGLDVVGGVAFLGHLDVLQDGVLSCDDLGDRVGQVDAFT